MNCYMVEWLNVEGSRFKGRTQLIINLIRNELNKLTIIKGN